MECNSRVAKCVFVVGGSGDGNFMSVMIQHEKAEFLLCTLEQGKHLQQMLDLNFTEGEEVTFFVNGKGRSWVAVPLIPVQDCSL